MHNTKSVENQLAKDILQKKTETRKFELLLSHMESLAATCQVHTHQCGTSFHFTLTVVMFVFVLTQVNCRKLYVVGVLLEMRAVAHKKLLLRTEVYP